MTVGCFFFGDDHELESLQILLLSPVERVLLPQVGYLSGWVGIYEIFEPGCMNHL